MKYYHITSPSNKQSILDDGLRPNSDGLIFVCTDWDSLESIARNQLFLSEFAIFRFEYNLQVKPDNVAELTASHQFIIETDCSIPAEFEGIFITIPTKWTMVQLNV